MSQAPVCVHGEPERGVHCERCRASVKIVTNGKVFRIREADGSFHQTWVSLGPEGPSHPGPWETRSYIRALKRYGGIMRARASQANEKWREL